MERCGALAITDVGIGTFLQQQLHHVWAFVDRATSAVKRGQTWGDCDEPGGSA
mgnify:CR=1 FL=1